jgi:hypothetical protein
MADVNDKEPEELDTAKKQSEAEEEAREVTSDFPDSVQAPHLDPEIAAKANGMP